MITPTVGRVVWYHPGIGDSSVARNGDQPLAALVTTVWSDTCVNLAAFDANGIPFNRTSVFLYQGDTDRPGGGYCEWMPYQKGQAAKAEAAEKALAEKAA
jgi:hypothetical protein